MIYVGCSCESQGEEEGQGIFSSSTTAEALPARGSSNHRKSKGDVSKSKTGNHKLIKNQCAFYKKEGHWKIDCMRLKKEKEHKSEVNFG